MLQPSSGACVDSPGHCWTGSVAASAAAARSRPASTSGRTCDWGRPSQASPKATTRSSAQCSVGHDTLPQHRHTSRPIPAHQHKARHRNLHCSAVSHSRSAPTTAAEHSTAQLAVAPQPAPHTPQKGQLSAGNPQGEYVNGQLSAEDLEEGHANGQLLRAPDSFLSPDTPSHPGFPIPSPDPQHSFAERSDDPGNGAISRAADSAAQAQIPGHADTPQQGGEGSSQGPWQPDWDRFEPFASISSSADSVDLAEEPVPEPSSSSGKGNGPQHRVRMATDALPWDAEFRPHEYLSEEDIELALSPNRMQAVTSDAQVWRTEAWALIQVAPSVRIHHGHGQEMGMFGLPLPRAGPFIIGSAADQDCDLIIDSPSVAPRHLRLELVPCGARGRVARMTATQIAPTEHLTWVNHQLMLQGREAEARSHNLITIGDPDIAFQVVPLQSVDSKAWARRSAQRYLAKCRAEDEDPLRAAIAGNPLDARSWALLGQREFRGAQAGQGGSYAAARTFMRAAATILTNEALRRSTRSEAGSESPDLPSHSHSRGVGAFTGPLSALTVPLGSLRRGGSASQKLAEHLAEWGHMELHNGLQDSARRLWRRAVEVCKPPTKAAIVGSTAMQVLLAWARLELQDGNLRVVSMLLRELSAAVPDVPVIMELKAELAFAGRGVRKARTTYAAALTALNGEPGLVAKWVRREVAAGHLRHGLRILESALVRHPGHSDLEQLRQSILHTPPKPRPGPLPVQPSPADQAGQPSLPSGPQQAAHGQDQLPELQAHKGVVGEAEEPVSGTRIRVLEPGRLERAYVRSAHGREWATLSDKQRPDRQRQERLKQVQSRRAFGSL